MDTRTSSQGTASLQLLVTKLESDHGVLLFPINRNIKEFKRNTLKKILEDLQMLAFSEHTPESDEEDGD